MTGGGDTFFDGKELFRGEWVQRLTDKGRAWLRSLVQTAVGIFFGGFLFLQRIGPVLWGGRLTREGNCMVAVREGKTGCRVEEQGSATWWSCDHGEVNWSCILVTSEPVKHELALIKVTTLLNNECMLDKMRLFIFRVIRNGNREVVIELCDVQVVSCVGMNFTDLYGGPDVHSCVLYCSVLLIEMQKHIEL